MEKSFSNFIGFIIKHWKIVIITSGLIILAIITIFTIKNINHHKNTAEREKNNAEGSITITNLDQYQKHKPNQEYLHYIDQDLYKTVNYNSDYIVEDNSITDASIRKDSFTELYNKKTQTYHISYLVDIPSLQQSYFVDYHWSPDSHSTLTPAPSTHCPTPKQLLYNEFDCRDYFIYQSDGTITYNRYADRFIYRLAPTTTTLEKGVVMKTQRRIDPNNNPYIEATLSICDSGNYIEDAKAVLKKHAEDQNLDISDYRIDFSIHGCIK